MRRLFRAGDHRQHIRAEVASDTVLTELVAIIDHPLIAPGKRTDLARRGPADTCRRSGARGAADAGAP